MSSEVAEVNFEIVRLLLSARGIEERDWHLKEKRPHAPGFEEWYLGVMGRDRDLSLVLPVMKKEEPTEKTALRCGHQIDVWLKHSRVELARHVFDVLEAL